MGGRKQFIALLGVLLLGLFLPLSVRAAGAEDSFYQRHADECSDDGRSYTLNGPEGYVTVYASPEGREPVDYLLNERSAVVHHVWQDGSGRSWGQLYYESLGRGIFVDAQQDGRWGWVRLRELQPHYDKTRFVKEHLSEFTMESVELDMRDYEKVNLWPFPGSGGSCVPASWYLRREEDNLLKFPAYWTDSQGRRWGGYRFFEANGFICLDEPGLEENLLPEVDISYRVIPAADAATLPRVPAGGRLLNRAVLPLSLGLGLAVLAAVFLMIRRKRQKT